MANRIQEDNGKPTINHCSKKQPQHVLTQKCLMNKPTKARAHTKMPHEPNYFLAIMPASRPRLPSSQRYVECCRGISVWIGSHSDVQHAVGNTKAKANSSQVSNPPMPIPISMPRLPSSQHYYCWMSSRGIFARKPLRSPTCYWDSPPCS